MARDNLYLCTAETVKVTHMVDHVVQKPDLEQENSGQFVRNSRSG
jgi:hypothetical protein